MLQVDPYLELVDDIRLQAVPIESNKKKILYGTQEDEVAASKSLSAIESDDQQLKETVISHFMSKFATLSEVIYQFIIMQSLKNVHLSGHFFNQNMKICSLSI